MLKWKKTALTNKNHLEHDLHVSLDEPDKKSFKNLSSSNEYYNALGYVFWFIVIIGFAHWLLDNFLP